MLRTPVSVIRCSNRGRANLYVVVMIDFRVPKSRMKAVLAAAQQH